MLWASTQQLTSLAIDLGLPLCRYAGKKPPFKSDMVDTALDNGITEGHCTAEEKQAIQKKKGTDKLVATYNVLRIHQFLGKYESDLNVRRSRNQKTDKPKLTKQQREEREAAIDHLVARMHPKPPQNDGVRQETPEEKAARKAQKQKNKALIENFLTNYTEDMHKRRLHIKQVRAFSDFSTSLTAARACSCAR